LKFISRAWFSNQNRMKHFTYYKTINLGRILWCSHGECGHVFARVYRHFVRKNVT
jgi:hypothetical protein